MRGYRDAAADLERRISEGEFPPGSTLPTIPELMVEYGMARQTIRSAVGVLSDKGLVVAMKKAGTIVRDRTPIRIPLSRYLEVLTPGGSRGPWETACAAQGLDGHMELKSVHEITADADLAGLLSVTPDSRLIHRRRHALIGSEVIQIQDAWYPRDLAETAGIAGDHKVVGGVYGALTGAGYVLTHAAELVGTRMPRPTEQTVLRIGAGVPLLTVQRLTRDQNGDAVEVVRVIAAGDRIELLYDPLPLTAGEVS